MHGQGCSDQQQQHCRTTCNCSLYSRTSFYARGGGVQIPELVRTSSVARSVAPTDGGAAVHQEVWVQRGNQSHAPNWPADLTSLDGASRTTLSSRPHSPPSQRAMLPEVCVRVSPFSGLPLATGFPLESGLPLGSGTTNSNFHVNSIPANA